jgi:pimeloyl-ACP methyl ester carboxylesterase
MLLKSNVIGKGSQTLVILHGFLGMSDNWKSYAKNISAFGFEVHLIDQRNHGKSFHSNDFSYDLMAKDLKNYLDFNKLRDILLIGHSMGGKTAMQFSSLFPSLVKKLVVVDILPIHYKSNFNRILNSLKSIDLNVIESRKEANEVLEKTIKEESLRGFLLKNLFRNAHKKLQFKFNLNVLFNKFNEVESALKIPLPFHGDTLFIKGENSNYINELDMLKAKKNFPNSNLVSIVNSGHWVHAENPNKFLEETIKFLKY